MKMEQVVFKALSESGCLHGQLLQALPEPFAGLVSAATSSPEAFEL